MSESSEMPLVLPPAEDSGSDGSPTRNKNGTPTMSIMSKKRFNDICSVIRSKLHDNEDPDQSFHAITRAICDIMKFDPEEVKHTYTKGHAEKMRKYRQRKAELDGRCQRTT